MKIMAIKFRYIMIAAVCLCMITASLCAVSISTFNAGGRNLPVYNIERNDNKIAITFDCAWNADDVDSILETLDKYNAKATFFVCGKWAESYPDALKKIYEHGHEIGNHSYNHADYSKLSYNEILADIAHADACVRSITGENPTVVRTPSGAYDDDAVAAVESTKRICVQWSVDSLDYGKKGEDADGIKSRILNHVQSGDILLFHNGTKYTAKVLPEILARLSSKYEFVTVSDIVYKDNFHVDRSGKMIFDNEKQSTE